MSVEKARALNAAIDDLTERAKEHAQRLGLAAQIHTFGFRGSGHNALLVAASNEQNRGLVPVLFGYMPEPGEAGGNRKRGGNPSPHRRDPKVKAPA